jgi:DNA-directed RNA polymerase subunit B
MLGTFIQNVSLLMLLSLCLLGKMDHMVVKKVHARARGPMQPLTRQPIEGRRNDGGFRLGNMEIDVLTGYGVAAILRERTTEVSDQITVYRCKQCGFNGDGNPDVGLFMCKFCQTAAHMRTLKQSCSSQVMFSELACSGISTRFILRDL